MMGGKIQVKSEEGKGSTFWFTAIFEKQDLYNDSSNTIKFSTTIKGKRILAVDDNPVNREIIFAYIKAWGCDLKVVSTGEEAFTELTDAATEENPYDVLICDMMMPEMDGVELVRLVKENKSTASTIIIMVTSCGMRGDAILMNKIGIDGYLNKPIKQSDLYNTIVSVLGVSEKILSKDKGKKIITRHTLKENKKKNARILLAEDNLINQKVASHMLKKFGYSLDTVVDGKEAVDALKNRHYALILMDIQMPEMDGYEATKQIRSFDGDKKDIPIVAMTANAMKGDREKCLDAGMNDYITKPVKPENLLAAISKWIK